MVISSRPRQERSDELAIPSDPVVRWGGRDHAFIVGGAVAVVAGGLVAAVSRTLGWERGPWAAAFLVLVAGVSQIGLGVGPLAGPAPPGPVDWMVVRQVLSWNVGCVLVLAGTWAIGPIAVTSGGLLLLAALWSFATSRRDHRRSYGAVLAYSSLLVALAVSVPIGIAMSWLRG